MDRPFEIYSVTINYPSILATAVTIQYLRSEVIDSKSLDFVRTARSKGVPTNKVFSRHIFRNAALPMASQMGYEITSLIAGSVVIERFWLSGSRKTIY